MENVILPPVGPSAAFPSKWNPPAAHLLKCNIDVSRLIMLDRLVLDGLHMMG